MKQHDIRFETPSAEGVSRVAAHRRLHLALLALPVVLTACPETGTGDTTTSTTVVSTSTVASVTASTTVQQTPSEYAVANCEFDVPEGREVECGWLEVPEDRSDLSKGTIRLHFAVFGSESDGSAPDPIIYLEGGPGGEILEVTPFVFEDRFAHLLADRDLILFDQRGTGYSEPSLACPELRELGLELLEQDLPSAEIRDLEMEALAECRDRLIEDGADLDSWYN